MYVLFVSMFLCMNIMYVFNVCNVCMHVRMYLGNVCIYACMHVIYVYLRGIYVYICVCVYVYV